MRILWILPYLPWPTTSGGKTRQYHLLRTLAEAGHHITLLVQSKTPLCEEGRAHLQPLLERLVVLPRRPLRSPKTLGAALLAPYPLLASVNGFAPDVQKQFAELLDEHWDVIQIEHSYTFEPYEAQLLKRKKAFVLTEHNVESSLGAATYDRLSPWLAPFVLYDQWRYRRWERRVMRQAQQVIAVTADDAAVLGPLSGRPTGVVVNGVDCRHYAEVAGQYEAPRLLFVGNFEYSPNIDALLWIVEDILPALWLQHPQLTFSVCGYGIDERWPQRWNDPRIEWHGFVEDLREQQRCASLFIAPLRQGGGSKLKVLEAMAAGLPVVCTAQGVSGLAVVDGEHFVRAETVQAFVLNILALLADPARATALGEAGRRYVQTEHDWSAAARSLESIYACLEVC